VTYHQGMFWNGSHSRHRSNYVEKHSPIHRVILIFKAGYAAQCPMIHHASYQGTRIMRVFLQLSVSALVEAETGVQIVYGLPQRRGAQGVTVMNAFSHRLAAPNTHTTFLIAKLDVWTLGRQQASAPSGTQLIYSTRRQAATDSLPLREESLNSRS
jgi:hypothetical protein